MKAALLDCFGAGHNNALEQTASAARPWQAAQGKAQAPGGPRPGRRPPLLTASVRLSSGEVSSG
jgi:hypothetical protein